MANRWGNSDRFYFWGLQNHCRWYYPNGEKLRETKEPLDEGERGSKKAGFKFNIQNTKIMASGAIISWQIDGGKI